MAWNNSLTLAVAGSRKTQSIVEQCAAAEPGERILILTYTTINQAELRRRISTFAGDRPNIEIMGWFAFLIAHFARPFVPFNFPGTSVRGFDNESPPQQYAPVADRRRYFTVDGLVRRVHLSQLAMQISDASSSAPIGRLARIYDRIYIDEVQDLCGYDLEVLKLLMASSVPVSMVGDVRQATLATNQRESKNKKYMYMGIWSWFQAEERAGHLSIVHRAETYRCRPEIAALADSLFGDEWGFAPTVSQNVTTTGHDGVHLVRSTDVDAYVKCFAPLALRDSAASGRELVLEFMNFGQVKGLGRERVLILPTEAIRQFLTRGKALRASQAAAFYVALTRAEQSAAIILDEPRNCPYPYWEPDLTWACV